MAARAGPHLPCTCHGGQQQKLPQEGTKDASRWQNHLQCSAHTARSLIRPVRAQVTWLPGERPTWLAVTTGGAVHVFDLAQAAHVPLLSLLPPEGGPLAGAAFCVAAPQARLNAYALHPQP